MKLKHAVLASLGAALLAAGCGQETPPPAAKADPSLQPKLEPPRQVVVIPAPEPVVARRPEPVHPAAEKEDPNAALAARVKRALEEESRIQAAAIDVTAAGGTVTLWGTAATNDERLRASRAAQRVAGVKWVDNRLAIASGS